MLAQLADLNSLDRRAYEYILEVLKVQIYTENRVWESNAWSEFCLEHWLIIHLFVIHLIDYKMLTNVCKFFSHWNYTIWYNKTLLAWYFKEKHWHSHWGDTKWSPAAFFFFFLIDFVEIEGESHVYVEGMCFVTPKRRGFCKFTSYLGVKCLAIFCNLEEYQVGFRIPMIKLMRFCSRRVFFPLFLVPLASLKSEGFHSGLLKH